MNFRHNGFDLWVYCEDPEPRYLLLRASEEKARRWFSGSQFWQVPSDFVEAGESVTAALDRELRSLGLTPTALWAVEHAYTIFNRRYQDVVLISVFAAKVESPREIRLGSGHADSGWWTAREARDRLTYRGLQEGLHWLRHHITESPTPPEELRLR